MPLIATCPPVVIVHLLWLTSMIDAVVPVTTLLLAEIVGVGVGVGVGAGVGRGRGRWNDRQRAGRGAGAGCPGGVGLGLAPPQFAAVLLPDRAVDVSELDHVLCCGIGNAVDRDLSARGDRPLVVANIDD